MSEPIIYGPEYSTFTRSVRLALEEKGAAYQLENIDMLGGAHKSDSFLAKHPFGKVPAFEHDGFELYETAAIIRYVDEAMAGPSLQPSEPKARARMNQILSVADNYAYGPLIGTIFIQRAVMPMVGEATDESAINDAKPAASTCIQALDKLVNPNPSGSLDLAEIELVPIMEYCSQIPEGQALLAEAPNLSAWWNNRKNHPSVVKTRPDLG